MVHRLQVVKIKKTGEIGNIIPDPMGIAPKGFVRIFLNGGEIISVSKEELVVLRIEIIHTDSRCLRCNFSTKNGICLRFENGAIGNIHENPGIVPSRIYPECQEEIYSC